MNGEPLRCSVVVRNSQGMHLRPAAAFAELAAKFQCEILCSVRMGKKSTARALSYFVWRCSEMGTELVLEATGPDAQEALDALAKFFEEWVTEP